MKQYINRSMEKSTNSGEREQKSFSRQTISREISPTKENYIMEKMKNHISLKRGAALIKTASTQKIANDAIGTNIEGSNVIFKFHLIS